MNSRTCSDRAIQNSKAQRHNVVDILAYKRILFSHPCNNDEKRTGDLPQFIVAIILRFKMNTLSMITHWKCTGSEIQIGCETIHLYGIILILFFSVSHKFTISPPICETSTGFYYLRAHSRSRNVKTDIFAWTQKLMWIHLNNVALSIAAWLECQCVMRMYSLMRVRNIIFQWTSCTKIFLQIPFFRSTRVREIP